MLTTRQVIKLAGRIDVELCTNKHSYFIKGSYLPDFELITIYLPDIDSEEDFDVTLVHEFIHARDKTSDCERTTEEEAIETYRRTPEIARFIRELFDLNWCWLLLRGNKDSNKCIGFSNQIVVKKHLSCNMRYIF